MKIHKLKIKIQPSSKRWLLRPFVPGNPFQVEHILTRILSTKEKKLHHMYERVFNKYKNTHPNIHEIFMKHFENVQHRIPFDRDLTQEMKLIIGAFFSHFYALESTALFNPSIVLSPHQPADGNIHFILSLRAVGEGHISSIVFREGMVHPDFEITMKDSSRFILEPQIKMERKHQKERFIRNLTEAGALNEMSEIILAGLTDEFIFADLDKLLGAHNLSTTKYEPFAIEETLRIMKNIGLSNYDVLFENTEDISERVIFPMSPSQTNGIEDARFIRFEEEDGSFKYYATFTAFNGREVVPEILETKDFEHFKVSSLSGSVSKNKGMAIFPKKINGKYMMLGRQDNESIYLMSSDDILHWSEAEPLLKPTFEWEFVQIGNCSSPIEIDEGWLVLTHGVGALRRYCIGAVLLDKQNPRKVLGRLKKPLMEPKGEERYGYVPNVLYTCGAIACNGRLIIPYAMSDSYTKFAQVEIQDILNEMV